MKYKLYISGYIEETQQLLISFSSDNTANDAADYQSLAFDVVPYGDVTAQEVIDMIAKVAPTICSDIVTQETYKDDSQKSQDFRALIGQSFEYDENDLFHSQAAIEREVQASETAEQVEEI